VRRRRGRAGARRWLGMRAVPTVTMVRTRPFRIRNLRVVDRARPEGVRGGAPRAEVGHGPRDRVSFGLEACRAGGNVAADPRPGDPVRVRWPPYSPDPSFVKNLHEFARKRTLGRRVPFASTGPSTS